MAKSVLYQIILPALPHIPLPFLHLTIAHEFLHTNSQSSLSKHSLSHTQQLLINPSCDMTWQHRGLISRCTHHLHYILHRQPPALWTCTQYLQYQFSAVQSCLEPLGCFYYGGSLESTRMGTQWDRDKRYWLNNWIISWQYCICPLYI